MELLLAGDKTVVLLSIVPTKLAHIPPSKLSPLMYCLTKYRPDIMCFG
jgi:hypothetical protein